MKKVKRYRCRYCNYIYSPLVGEPRRGIPAGTEFEDLPDDYKCPLCIEQVKGRIGKAGFEPWIPTKWRCKICGYVYDSKRGEPQHGIAPQTAFEDLPDDYTCPVCGLDVKITEHYGKVYKGYFDPLMTE